MGVGTGAMPSVGSKRARYLSPKRVLSCGNHLWDTVHGRTSRQPSTERGTIQSWNEDGELPAKRLRFDVEWPMTGTVLYLLPDNAPVIDTLLRSGGTSWRSGLASPKLPRQLGNCGPKSEKPRRANAGDRVRYGM
jgi:hypothetical protein